MKKMGIVFATAVVLILLYLFINKSYYPALPVENVSAKEVISKLENSDEKMVEFAKDNGTDWYITKSENKGVSNADELTKQKLYANGWEFKEKLGAGLFFEKENRELIVTTQMWTKKYVIIQIGEAYKKQ